MDQRKIEDFRVQNLYNLPEKPETIRDHSKFCRCILCDAYFEEGKYERS